MLPRVIEGPGGEGVTASLGYTKHRGGLIQSSPERERAWDPPTRQTFPCEPGSPPGRRYIRGREQGAAGAARTHVGEAGALLGHRRHSSEARVIYPGFHFADKTAPPSGLSANTKLN